MVVNQIKRLLETENKLRLSDFPVTSRVYKTLQNPLQGGAFPGVHKKTARTASFIAPGEK